MYRWFIIFALLNFANSADLLSRALCRGDVSRYCRPSKARYYGPPHNYYHGNGQTETDTSGPPTVQPLPPANTFEDLAQNLATAESAIRKYCQDNSNGDVKDVFGADHYILKYRLSDFRESDINVKIKHRVIYVTANRPGWVPFKDLRVLPNILNTRLASWSLANKYLKVVIPYNIPFRREAVNECGNVNDAIIEVPSMKSNFIPRESLEPTTEKVPTSTLDTQPKTPINNEADTISIDDAWSIISPSDYENLDIDIRYSQV